MGLGFVGSQGAVALGLVARQYCEREYYLLRILYG